MAKDIKIFSRYKNFINLRVDILADTVKVTLGPKRSQCCSGKSFSSPLAPMTGVTIAKESGGRSF